MCVCVGGVPKDEVQNEAGIRLQDELEASISLEDKEDQLEGSKWGVTWSDRHLRKVAHTERHIRVTQALWGGPLAPRAWPGIINQDLEFS